jgi:hypothetical protein
MKIDVKRKIWVIGALFLFLGVSAATLGVNAQTWWLENFDSYTNGQFLDGGADDGGWKGFCNNPSYGAYVTNAQSHTSPNSVEINGTVDLVHEYEGYTSGTLPYRCLQYIPANFSGESYFILLSEYDDSGSTNIWTVQLRFDSDLDVVESEFTGEQAPLVYDTWVEIECYIDLDTDWLQIYYNGALLSDHAWTDTVQGTGGGTLNVAAVDLFANGATSVYYDDMFFPFWLPPFYCDAGGPYTGEVNKTVQFTGSITGGTAPYSWEWKFGDGGTATEQNATHIYTAPGTYTVILRVMDWYSFWVTDYATVTIVTPQPVPMLEIGAITGGFGVESSVKNTGEGAATNVTWSITLDGKGVFLGKSTTGIVATLATGGEKAIKTGFIFGIGKTNIIVSATCDEGVTIETTETGFVLGLFVFRVK